MAHVNSSHDPIDHRVEMLSSESQDGDVQIVQEGKTTIALDRPICEFHPQKS